MNLPATITETLNEVQRPIAEAMSGEKIRTLEPAKLRGVVAENIKRAIKLTGIKDINPEDISADINLLTPIIRRNHGGITADELRYITEQGSIGKFGKFYGINPKTIIEWVEAYKNSEERKQTLRTIRKLSQSEESALNAPEIPFAELWENAKADYLKTGKVLGAAYLYEKAKENKLINLTPDQVEDCKANARINAASRIHDLKQSDIWKGRHLADKYKDENGQAFKNLCRIEAIKLMFKD